MPDLCERIDLRITPAMKSALVALAAREHRSINAQLLVIIESAIADNANRTTGRLDFSESERRGIRTIAQEAKL